MVRREWEWEWEWTWEWEWEWEWEGEWEERRRATTCRNRCRRKILCSRVAVVIVAEVSVV